MSLRKAPAPVIKRADGPGLVDLAERCGRQTLLANGPNDLDDARLAARVVQKRKEVGGLQLDRFGGVLQPGQEQTEQVLLLARRLDRLPQFGDGETADPASGPQVHFPISIPD